MGTKNKKEILIAIILFAPLLMLFWHRLFLGVELTDEVTYVTYAYRLYMGDAPILDTREIQLFGSLLLVPVIKIWIMLTGTLDGIMIVSRIYYLFLVLLNYIFIVFCIKKVLGRIGFYTAFPIIFVSYASLFNISYNTMSYLFLSGALFALFGAFNEENLSQKLLFCISGILHAISVLNYPTFLFLCIIDICTVYFYLKINRSSNTVKCTLLFTFSGICTAIIILLMFLIWAKGDVLGLIQGVKEVLHSPYWKTSNSVYLILNEIIVPELKVFFRSGTFILWVLCSIVDFGVRKIIKSDKKIGICQLVYVVLYGIVLKNIAQHGYSQVKGFYMILFITILYRFFTIQNKKIRQKVGFSLILPYFTAVIIRLFSTNTRSPFVQTFLAMPILAVYLYMSLPNETYVLKNRFNNYAVIINSFLISIMLLVSNYTYIYRDEPVMKLTERVETGIYKGLYTSSERKDHLYYLQNKIDEYIDPQKTLLVANHFPAAYMMSGSKPLTPDVWDAFYSDRNLKDASMVYQYFNTVEKKPDTIIFVDYPDNQYKNNDSSFEFNNYIRQNYTLQFDDMNETVSYRLTVYTVNSSKEY